MITVYYSPYELAEGESRYHKEHEWGRRLLKYGLEKQYGRMPDPDEQMKRLAHGAYGKPFFRGGEEIAFSISHCRGWVVCALSEDPVGIDIERIAPFSPSMAARVLTEKEQSYLRAFQGQKAAYKECFFRFWTGKESYLKWSGRGFFTEPKEVELAFDKELEAGRIWCSDPRVGLWQRKWNEDYILSICCEKKEVEIKYEPYEKTMAGAGSQLPD